jgi:hypothetical protein
LEGFTVELGCPSSRLGSPGFTGGLFGIIRLLITVCPQFVYPRCEDVTVWLLDEGTKSRL